MEKRKYLTQHSGRLVRCTQHSPTSGGRWTGHPVVKWRQPENLPAIRIRLHFSPISIPSTLSRANLLSIRLLRSRGHASFLSVCFACFRRRRLHCSPLSCVETPAFRPGQFVSSPCLPPFVPPAPDFPYTFFLPSSDRLGLVLPSDTSRIRFRILISGLLSSLYHIGPSVALGSLSSRVRAPRAPGRRPSSVLISAAS